MAGWDRGCGVLPFKGVKRRSEDGRKYLPVFFIVALVGLRQKGLIRSLTCTSASG